MTDKLYYKDAYIKEFTADVLSVTEADGGFDVILDKTAFFPEEGGQSSDTGYIGSSRMLHAHEKNGIIHHHTDTAPALGRANCIIDFDQRFEKMQCHTAEHIISGITKRLFGFDNVGFHLGDDEVTCDFNGVLDRSQLDHIEKLANDAVFANIKAETGFPSSAELAELEYRSKLNLTEGVRIVKIGDVDTCACCAPHVSMTGEIGLIKILDFIKHRGGTRIWMVAGKRALWDYRKKYENIKKISALLSAPQSDVASVLESYIKETEDLKLNHKNAKMKIAELNAASVQNTEGSEVFVLHDFGIAELIAFSNIANKRVGGITVAISGVDGDYKYVISSNSVDLRAISKDINLALSGRGGGRPEMIQGSFAATLEEIKEYFK